MEIGEQVRAARETRGWSQAKLASQVGCSRPYISRVESGSRDVSIDVLRRLVSVLELDPAAVLDTPPSLPEALPT